MDKNSVPILKSLQSIYYQLLELESAYFCSIRSFEYILLRNRMNLSFSISFIHRFAFHWVSRISYSFHCSWTHLWIGNSLSKDISNVKRSFLFKWWNWMHGVDTIANQLLLHNYNCKRIWFYAKSEQKVIVSRNKCYGDSKYAHTAHICTEIASEPRIDSHEFKRKQRTVDFTLTWKQTNAFVQLLSATRLLFA